MDLLLFADHLRRMRNPRHDRCEWRRALFDLSGAGKLLGACAAGLLLVMLQVALSAPAAPSTWQQVAQIVGLESAR